MRVFNTGSEARMAGQTLSATQSAAERRVLAPELSLGLWTLSEESGIPLSAIVLAAATVVLRRTGFEVDSELFSEIEGAFSFFDLLAQLRASAGDQTRLSFRQGEADSSGAVLAFEDTGSALELGVEHGATPVNREAALRLLERLPALLAGLVADPGGRLSELPVLSAAERHLVLVEWCDTER
ncbi:MAG TPA: hypothetical protein VGH73_00490, partial [Thermoanaerobaculia bacterium]